MSQLPPVVAIFGPTGSGKTLVAVHVARLLATSVINCDPAQCYEGLPTLTNKPSPDENQIAPHRLVGCWNLDHDATAAEFSTLAHAEVDALVRQNGHAVLCGGSGMYLRAALSALQFAGDDELDRGGDERLRKELHERYEREGAQALHTELSAADSQVAARIHPNDRKRLVRALEVVQQGGSVAPDGGSIWNAPYRHDSLLVGLEPDRQPLIEAIARRTRSMFDRGVLDEVADVVGAHAERLEQRLGLTARRIHGVQDCCAVLDGSIDEQAAVERLEIRTRQYARRQMTWARRWPGLWMLPTGSGVTPDTAAEIATLLVAQGSTHAIRQVAGPR